MPRLQELRSMVLLLFLLSGKLCAKRCRRMSDPNHGKQSGHGCGSGSTPAPAVAEISVGATSGTTCSASGSFASDSVANSHLTLASAPARFFEPRCFLAKTRFETPSGGFLIVGVAISSSVFAFFWTDLYKWPQWPSVFPLSLWMYLYAPKMCSATTPNYYHKHYVAFN